MHSILLFTLNKEEQKIVDAFFLGGGYSHWSSLKSKCDLRFDNNGIVNIPVIWFDYSLPKDEKFMHHQWMEGNLPVTSKCAVCDKSCGLVIR